ncbi:hypothetical protein [uncultured Victivallis sp.]|nr:hypothetical protein [uncultured Victivallis sp.]
MKENIQLNHVVSPGKFRMLKYGLGYYTWVKNPVETTATICSR